MGKGRRDRQQFLRAGLVDELSIHLTAAATHLRYRVAK